ncbi:hypothetical protein FRC09_017433 [Ceratobasidium sp. 395]|nr:hypothetical protein FRC09_017433 [Ceratobasidium sp. 395]
MLSQRINQVDQLRTQLAHAKACIASPSARSNPSAALARSEARAEATEARLAAIKYGWRGVENYLDMLSRCAAEACAAFVRTLGTSEVGVPPSVPVFGAGPTGPYLSCPPSHPAPALAPRVPQQARQVLLAESRKTGVQLEPVADQVQEHALTQAPPRPPHLPTRSPDARLRSPLTPLARPVRPRVAHVPSLTPLITRETFKELDLEAILRSPQLRHDLLFDPGLQFRPTSGRKKRELTKKNTGKPSRSRSTPDAYAPASTNAAGACLASVVLRPHQASARPCPRALHRSSTSSVKSSTRSHGVFDSRGVFRTLGAVLKQHCAPMRDRAVEMMVTVAARPGGGVRAVQMCLEILELMKLLQALRPYLFETAVEFELETFQERHERGLLTLTTTQAWLRKAALTAPSTSTLPLLSHALTGLIFSPPTNVSTPPLPTTTPLSQRLPNIAPTSGYPGTLYLDHARLAGLTADAANLGMLYMLLVLFRQLVFSNPSGATTQRKPIVLEDSVVDRVKREIWEEKEGGAEWDKWHAGMRDVVLQVAVRAEEVRWGVQSTPESPVLPDAQTLTMLESWMDTNLRTGAPLERLLKGPLEKAVGEVVGRCIARNSVGASARRERRDDSDSDEDEEQAEEPRDAATPAITVGHEPLMPEIRHFGE